MNKRLFAIGDIHGCFDAFRSLLEQKIQIKESDQIILLGDYIDRGTQSKEVIDYIIDLKAKGFDIVPLLGNHEAMLLDAYENEELVSTWIQNGGSETLKSFNITSLKDIEPNYIEFFKGLTCYHALDEYLFVHGGFNDSDINPFADKYSMIWVCRKTYENPLLINKIIIHAHRPIPVDACKKIVHSNNNVINLDTGCVYSNMTGYGTLTAIELNTRSLYFA
ncbi:MAG: metallophosphoesterase family protein [Bacteroidales bacterium]|nr:metallophosphoesterase family protein [Bacteroidales bacterium]